MPPRIPLFSCLRSNNAAPSHSSLVLRPFSTTPVAQGGRGHRHRDPYSLAQAAARKAANLSRREALRKEREEGLGDPVRGNTTPFLEAFDTAQPPPPKATQDTPSAQTASSSPTEPPPGPDATQETYLKHFFTQDEIAERLKYSKYLSAPLMPPVRLDEPTKDELAKHEREHDNAVAAISRIVSLSNGNSKDRLRANIQRCIATFGRHNTDETLPPKPTALSQLPPAHTLDMPSAPREELVPGGRDIKRAGPDTGSSEVQVAILTAKIRTLAEFMGTRGKQDKVNKRNLRLLVHKRQKLLRYLKRKERGGPRWQHLVDTLGLTEGTWKGEISL